MSEKYLSIHIYGVEEPHDQFSERVHEALLGLCACRNKRWRMWWRKIRGLHCSIGMTASRWEALDDE